MQKLNQFSRTELLLGKEGLQKLADSTVAVFGVGGVGSFAVEGLARAGIGHLVLIDNDVISMTNINRQLHSTLKTIGHQKTTEMQQRIADINPACQVDVINAFYLPDKAADFFQQHYDYVIDAIDTVAGKISLAQECYQRQIPLISSMGAGNKLDPTKFEVADIFATSVDPLARVLRKKLKELHIPHLKVVYSKEKPKRIADTEGVEHKNSGRVAPGSISFVPSVVGFIIAGVVVRDLTGTKVEVGA